MPDRLTKLSELAISRVAFVGAGDNPAATIELWKSKPDEVWLSMVTKRTFTKAQRIELAKSGAAIPVKKDGEIVDGRYPIENVADLKNAMRAIGRVAEGDREQVVAHIRKRAKALGASDQLGDTFKGDPRLTAARLGLISEAVERIESLLRLGGGREAEMPETEKTAFEFPDGTPDEVKKHVEELEQKLTDAEAESKRVTDELEAEKSRKEKPEEGDADPIAKALESSDVDEGVKALLKSTAERAEKAEKDAAENRAELEKDRDAAADRESIAKVKELKNLGIEADKVGPALRKFAASDADAAAEVERALRAADAQAKEAMLEIGKSSVDESSAEGRLSALAEKIATDENVTKEIAMAKAVETPEGKRLMREAREESTEGVS